MFAKTRQSWTMVPQICAISKFISQRLALQNLRTLPRQVSHWTRIWKRYTICLIRLIVVVHKNLLKTKNRHLVEHFLKVLIFQRQTEIKIILLLQKIHLTKHQYCHQVLFWAQLAKLLRSVATTKKRQHKIFHMIRGLILQIKLKNRIRIKIKERRKKMNKSLKAWFYTKDRE